MIWRRQKGAYVCKAGNYLRAKVQKENEEQWGMYMAIKSWKEDGAERTDVGPYFRVATINANSYKVAIVTAEKKIRECIKDQAEAAGMKVEE